MNDSEGAHPDHVDKGKGRAATFEATERTPLLASSSHTAHDDSEAAHYVNRRLLSKLILVFLVSLFLCVVILSLAALLAYSYVSRVSQYTPSDFLTRGLVAAGPDRVDVLNITSDGGLWLNIHGRMGVDAGSVVGVRNEEERDSFFKDVWKAVGRWGIRRLSFLSVDLETITVFQRDKPSISLASIQIAPFQLPLAADPPRDLSWLTHVSLPVFIKPTSNASAIIHFVQESWKQGAIAVQAHVTKVNVHAGSLDDHGWRNMFKTARVDVETSIRVKVPRLPGLPLPGANHSLPAISDLVHLEHFEVISRSDRLLLNASASVMNPVPASLDATIPSLQFIVSLPSENYSSVVALPVASVYTNSFRLTHPNVSLTLTGFVLPLPSAVSSYLSQFLSRYLSEQDNPIIVSSPLFPALSVDALFPSPKPKPDIFRDVTIHNMKIRTTPAGEFLASGAVYARVVLPKEINVHMEVNRVFPDLLIFDGEVPDYIVTEANTVSRMDVLSPPPSPPLPDPLPERAFAHIRPDDWVESVSIPDVPGENEGAVYIVTADIEDVPLEVLPGRENEFSRFVSKVIFGSNGALAGIRGSAAVAVSIQGLPMHDGGGSSTEMELTGLPFKGRVRVGRKAMLGIMDLVL